MQFQIRPGLLASCGVLAERSPAIRTGGAAWRGEQHTPEGWEVRGRREGLVVEVVPVRGSPCRRKSDRCKAVVLGAMPTPGRAGNSHDAYTQTEDRLSFPPARPASCRMPGRSVRTQTPRLAAPLPNRGSPQCQRCNCRQRLPAPTPPWLTDPPPPE